MRRSPRERIAELERVLEELRTLRGESRLKIHLASMDARGEWTLLEARIVAAERRTARTGNVTESALESVVTLAKEVDVFLGCL
jgi:hypothetical protein